MLKNKDTLTQHIRRSEELAVLLGKDKERAAGGTALYLVGGTIMTEKEFTGSKVA